MKSWYSVRWSPVHYIIHGLPGHTDPHTLDYYRSGAVAGRDIFINHTAGQGELLKNDVLFSILFGIQMQVM